MLVAIGVSVVFILLADGNLVACHRIARMKLPDGGRSASEEWLNGAMATRDVVHDGFALRLLPFFILLALVFYLFFKSRPSKRKETGLVLPIENVR